MTQIYITQMNVTMKSGILFSSEGVPISNNTTCGVIREIPDHTTFREKEHTLGWLDKLGGFLSLALCNLANFDQL